MEKWPIQFVDLPRLWFSSSQTVSVPEGMSLIQPYGVDPFAPTCSLICCMLYNDFSSILIPQNNIGYDSCFFFGGGGFCMSKDSHGYVWHIILLWSFRLFLRRLWCSMLFPGKAITPQKKNKIYAMLICQEHSCAPHFWMTPVFHDAPI